MLVPVVAAISLKERPSSSWPTKTWPLFVGEIVDGLECIEQQCAVVARGRARIGRREQVVERKAAAVILRRRQGLERLRPLFPEETRDAVPRHPEQPGLPHLLDSGITCRLASTSRW